MKLIDVIDSIEDQDSAATIWISNQLEWSTNSLVVVAEEPEDGTWPASVASDFVYFLEVFIAIEVLEGMLQNTSYEKAVRVIEYAKNDA